jgi:BioD-like phosphotransacetylase family protein
MNLAKNTKVPIVIVKNDTLHIMEALEGIFDKAKLSHEWKVQQLEQLLEQHLDRESIYNAVNPQ